MTNKTVILKNKLNEDIQRLQKAIKSFRKSFEICKRIGIKDEFSFEEEESFDSLTSKFSRISDVYIQKVLKTALLLKREDWGSTIDMINKCEKISLINSAEDVLMIRDLRNSIVHEYAEDIIKEIYSDTLELSEKLIINVNDSIDTLRKDYI